MERFLRFEGLFEFMCSLKRSSSYICLHLKVSSLLARTEIFQDFPL